MPSAKDYEQVNTCLFQLGELLKKIGITEFSVSTERHSVVWDTKQTIDRDLLGELCESITLLYNKKKS